MVFFMQSSVVWWSGIVIVAVQFHSQSDVTAAPSGRPCKSLCGLVTHRAFKSLSLLGQCYPLPAPPPATLRRLGHNRRLLCNTIIDRCSHRSIVHVPGRSAARVERCHRQCVLTLQTLFYGNFNVKYDPYYWHKQAQIPLKWRPMSILWGKNGVFKIILLKRSKSIL